ncbi:MAG: N-acetylmuramoyl-L-alanine amidase [Novosphingobium sp. 28-62-57]|uniref:N-acetylmuramoyl-L-alanine amidase family protein n=1 Tax=unclassified Novosphingobium TaxID=2644732 RepID=UPI000BD17C14|nr:MULTISPECIES: N-acetylmuramoyl-L-alanine amidase [unclassified Novosphingobium]OYW48980.1 MAG: N-acetylmuramoyl-L-alanine amidase [Novosphingobium sp. 12-62-10]OYZ09553.1 MAG: N-acetylmuramoyl-L-alanine amidase [Novosphingobium sp. 28-62-57]OZA31582.1 MAG: N-acetylmuramoyl-L-alanine amidase [Novosphingobium sp. 17-62-9]HQS70938.1 N-acetylmuramoyl-L-alanine amidase [Novosphingobium sp.]
MDDRGLIAAIFAAPVLAAAAMWAAFSTGIAKVEPRYVVRLDLPASGGKIGLPKIEGPADTSRPLVVIDAGHGGHDPGASGAKGEREKDLTLALAKALRDQLLADGRVRVAMTRDTDTFLVLEERSDIARRLGADLFISVHADAAQSPAARGATVYTLSDKASDSVAEAMASRENRSNTINGVSLEDKDAVVSSILVDLSRREMRGRSIRFGELVVRESTGRLRFHATPQREAAFIVLKSLDLPSALIEAGYISNAEDASAMRDPAWRKDFARAVAQAAEIFLAEKLAPATIESPAAEPSLAQRSDLP